MDPLRASLIFIIALMSLFTLVMASDHYMLFAEPAYDDSLDLPDVYIETEDGMRIGSGESVACYVRISDEDSYIKEMKASILSDEQGSWSHPKRSFDLHFDMIRSLFGSRESENWCLLADYEDNSLSRNFLALTVAEIIGNDCTTCTQHVNLHINGKYNGVYLLTEDVRSGRTNDESLEILIEMVNRLSDVGEEGIDYFVVDGHSYAAVDAECSPIQLAEIQSALLGADKDLRSKWWNRVMESINVESFARSYIVEELFHDWGVSHGGFLLFLDETGKLKCGPVWDFEHCAGDYKGARSTSYKSPNNLYVAEESPWYGKLLQYTEFRQMVSDLLSEYADSIGAAIWEKSEEMRQYAGDYQRNFEQWPPMYGVFGPLLHVNWESELDSLVNWLESSLDHMVRVYCTESAD